MAQKQYERLGIENLFVAQPVGQKRHAAPRRAGVPPSRSAGRAAVTSVRKWYGPEHVLQHVKLGGVITSSNKSNLPRKKNFTRSATNRQNYLGLCVYVIQ